MAIRSTRATTIRPVDPGDNRLGVDVMVRSLPLIRGIRAARLFTNPKDEGDSFTSVRLQPHDDRMIITAATPLAMFITSAALVEGAWSDAGVIDLTVDQVAQLVSIYGANPDGEAQMRITAGESKVRTVDASGLIDGLNHNWDRRAMQETAPDVPQVVAEVWPAVVREKGKIPPISQTVTAAAEKAAAIFNKADLYFAATDTHHLISLGVAAHVISIIPDEFRPGAKIPDAAVETLGSTLEPGESMTIETGASAGANVVTFTAPKNGGF